MAGARPCSRLHDRERRRGIGSELLSGHLPPSAPARPWNPGDRAHSPLSARPAQRPSPPSMASDPVFFLLPAWSFAMAHADPSPPFLGAESSPPRSLAAGQIQFAQPLLAQSFFAPNPAIPALPWSSLSSLTWPPSSPGRSPFFLQLTTPQ
jgi:hypothetical protein